MFSFFKRHKTENAEVFSSSLYDEKTFYQAFINDIQTCKSEIIIESPFITYTRASMLIPIFKKLLDREIKVYVITRDPKEHDLNMEQQSEKVIRIFETIGIQVLICKGNHHRKLAIIDRQTLWEGSLNILSQTHSREIMRRIVSKDTAMEMFQFLRLNRFI